MSPNTWDPLRQALDTLLFQEAVQNKLCPAHTFYCFRKWLQTWLYPHRCMTSAQEEFHALKCLIKQSFINAAGFLLHDVVVINALNKTVDNRGVAPSPESLRLKSQAAFHVTDKHAPLQCKVKPSRAAAEDTWFKTSNSNQIRSTRTHELTANKVHTRSENKCHQKKKHLNPSTDD